jgi:hypothetical protein
MLLRRVRAPRPRRGTRPGPARRHAAAVACSNPAGARPPDWVAAAGLGAPPRARARVGAHGACLQRAAPARQPRPLPAPLRPNQPMRPASPAPPPFARARRRQPLRRKIYRKHFVSAVIRGRGEHESAEMNTVGMVLERRRAAPRRGGAQRAQPARRPRLAAGARAPAGGGAPRRGRAPAPWSSAALAPERELSCECVCVGGRWRASAFQPHAGEATCSAKRPGEGAYVRERGGAAYVLLPRRTTRVGRRNSS